MKKIDPASYKSLKKGNEYFFKSFNVKFFEEDGKTRVEIKEESPKKGELISVSTKWKENKDEKGKTVSKEVVGSVLEFVPENNKRIWESTQEELTIYKTTITCGLFQILK